MGRNNLSVDKEVLQGQKIQLKLPSISKFKSNSIDVLQKKIGRKLPK